ncbi:MAG: NADH:ubiquinone reductase (Na(+)-transporting) subunit B [Planctomycetales bacterium]|nr:NADH:ubiquinone reductase (Na(+)-transporting) subunit B [Planctomycetales bacterium]
MKLLRKILDGIEPAFKDGGKLSLFYPLYEAADTFLYTPADKTSTGSHIRDSLDLKRMMTTVILALTPCIFMAFYNTGLQANQAIASSSDITYIDSWRIPILESLGCKFDPQSFVDNLLHGAAYFLPVYIVCMTVGGLWEVIFSIVRKHEVNEGFLVTGMLFPLTLPPTIPLWQVALGISFGVVIGKEVFGGTVKNFLNPALTARAFLYFSHAGDITGDRVWTAADGFSGATPLGVLATLPVDGPVNIAEAVNLSWMQNFLGTVQGSMGETSTLACLLGAALLIRSGIGCWRIMAGVLLGAFGLSTILWLVGSEKNALFALGPHWHLVIGGFAFGTVFMATDPVSAAMTATGKWLYGILIGVMTILIRVINPAFPEGIMLAILFGNVMAPLIDYYVIQANVKRRKARYAA